MTHEEIIAKFWTNVEFSGKISKKKAAALLEMLQNLEKAESTRKLILLTVA